jgi:GntR family transcriptional regulator
MTGVTEPETTSPISNIDRSSAIPFYHQLKTFLRAEISSRGLRPGDRLPGDAELCERYAVSRTVVRQALGELEFEGVIERVKGRGTFVAPERSNQRLVDSVRGLYEDVVASGRTIRSIVRRAEIISAPARVASALQLEEGAPVFVLERLRFIDDVPSVFATTYLPPRLGAFLEQEDLEHESLYAILERHGCRPRTARRAVEARVARGSLAHDLGIPAGAPVLYLTSVGYGLDGTPVELFEAVHRGDRSRFVVDVDGPDALHGIRMIDEDEMAR